MPVDQLLRQNQLERCPLLLRFDKVPAATWVDGNLGFGILRAGQVPARNRRIELF
jgi:hypothetical protein